jgi:hypothetical protein
MGNVTVTIRVVDDDATPAPIDDVLVRVFNSGGTFLTSGVTGSVTPGSGEVDFTLNGEVAGEDYSVLLSKDGVSFPPAPTKVISVTDPPNPNNTFQFTGHIGMVGQLVTFSVKDDQGTPQPVEGVGIRVFTGADAFITALETDAAGEAELVLDGSASPGTGYIVRLTPASGYTMQNGPTQTFNVLDPVSPPDTNTFDFTVASPSAVPTSPDPDMCRVSGYFIDSSKRPIDNLSLIFHPREGYPDVALSGVPYSGEPSAISGMVVASDRRVNTDSDGYVEFDLPRGGVFDLFVQGMDAGDTTLLAEVIIPDAAGVDILEVLYPYVTELTYATDTVAVAIDGAVTLGVTAVASNGQDVSSVIGDLIEFSVDDEDVALVEVVDGVLTITGVAAGVVTLSAERITGTVATRLPSVADLEIAPAEPTITVS